MLHADACPEAGTPILDKQRQRRRKPITENCDKTYCDLLPQEIQVLLAVAQALLRCAELVDEQLFRFGDGVGEHDVGLKEGEGVSRARRGLERAKG